MPQMSQELAPWIPANKIYDKFVNQFVAICVIPDANIICTHFCDNNIQPLFSLAGKILSTMTKESSI